MKMKRIMIAGAFMVAITASFAFKNKELSTVFASYHPYYEPWECASQFPILDGDDCSSENTGAACTIEDWQSGMNVQAYEYSNTVPGDECIYPLYHEF